ncbi:hypothetical protein EJB05_18418, partial [Eragrostis curvula]
FSLRIGLVNKVTPSLPFSPPLLFPCPFRLSHRLDSDRRRDPSGNGFPWPNMPPVPRPGIPALVMADVILWRRKEVAGGSVGRGGGFLGSLFYCVPCLTLLSFVSQVLMILLTVLFIWAKAARLLNR